MFHCFGVRLVPPFSKKGELSKWLKNRENRTINMEIISSFLAKPVDKNGITLVHITYPPPLINLNIEIFSIFTTEGCYDNKKV